MEIGWKVWAVWLLHGNDNMQHERSSNTGLLHMNVCLLALAIIYVPGYQAEKVPRYHDRLNAPWLLRYVD